MAKKKAPRVRKVETVRERNEKATAKAVADSNKVKRQRIRKIARKASKPFAKPAVVILKPFKLRPIRFLGRWIGRILLPRYFRNSYKELKQVTWPSRRETWKLTFAVLLFATVFGFFIAITDLGLDKIIRRIVLR